MGTTTLPTCALAVWRKRGPRGDSEWEPVRLRGARTQHLTVELRGRPCSITPTLSCVPEGPLFSGAAFSAGERAPFRKGGRGCVVEGAPRVHAGAPGSKSIDFSLSSIPP